MSLDPCSEGCLNHNIGANTIPGAGDDPCNTNGNGYFCLGSYWQYDPAAIGADPGVDGDCPRLFLRNGGDCGVNQWLEVSLASMIVDTVPPVNGVDCCPPGTQWCVPAGTGGTTVNQVWVSTDGCGTCTWCLMCGHAVTALAWNEITAGAAITIAEDIVVTPGHTQIDEDVLNNQGPGSGQITVPRTGCYDFSGSAVLNYYDLDFLSCIVRLHLVVNGAPLTLIGASHGMTLTRPPGLVITLIVNGSLSGICLNAGDVVEAGVEFHSNIGGQTIDISTMVFQMHEIKA